MALLRETKISLAVAVGTNSAGSAAVDYRPYAGGRIGVPTGSSITTLTFYTAPTPAGVFLPAQGPDSDYGVAVGSALQITVAAAKSYPIPPSLFAVGSFLAVGDHTGTIDVVTTS